MSDIKKLRDEVLKRHAAASAKISRIKRSTGANVSGTEFDPRRNVENVKRYNARQLNAYKSELNEFMRRGNQFVAGAKGPIFKGTAARLARVQSEYESIRQAHDASVGNVQTPTGMSVRQNKAVHPEAHGSAVFGPYKKMQFDVSDVKDEASAKKLISDLVRKSASNYLPEKIARDKENFIKAVVANGDAQFVNDILALSDYQFDLMWYGTSLPEATFLKYNSSEKNESEEDEPTKKERWQDRVTESVSNELPDVLEWAQSQPTERPRNVPEASEKIKGFKR